MLARYFLFDTGSGWAVTLEGHVMGKYGSRTEAREAAIVMADLMGAMNHDADVMISGADGLELVWTFGQDRIEGRRRRSKPTATAPRHVVKVQQAAT